MDEEFYIDCDGVILDTQTIIDKLFMEYGGDEKDPVWNEVLKNLNWVEIIRNSKEINNSLEVLRKLYELRKKAYILSRVFSEREARAKSDYFLENGVWLDFIPVFGRVPKSSIITPNPKRLLVDDSESNIRDWKQYGAPTIWIPKDEEDIKFLLKR